MNPTTLQAEAAISISGIDDHAHLAVGEGSVWVTVVLETPTQTDGVVRIDPTTNQVAANINISGYVKDIVVGGGTVWVTTSGEPSGTLVGINPSTNRVIGAPLTLPGSGPGPIAYIDGVLWITNLDSGGSLTRLDAATLTELSTPSLPGVNGTASSLSNSVWVAKGENVVRLDPGSAVITATIPINRAADVAVTAGAVWVLSVTGSTDPDLYDPDPLQPEFVSKIDPATNQVTATANLGESPASLGIGEGATWVADYDGGIVWKVVG